MSGSNWVEGLIVLGMVYAGIWLVARRGWCHHREAVERTRGRVGPLSRGRLRSVTFDSYLRRTGCIPYGDDLERANCDKAGEPGHRQCGWCVDHDLPRTMCGCMAKLVIPTDL